MLVLGTTPSNLCILPELRGTRADQRRVSGLFQTPLVPTQIGFHSAAAVIRAGAGAGAVSASPVLLAAGAGRGVASPPSAAPPPPSAVSLAGVPVSLSPGAGAVPALVPSSAPSAFPLLTPAPSRSLSVSHSPPLALAQPPRPPSSPCPSPSPLVVKDPRELREPVSSLVLRSQDVDPVRELRERATDRELRERALSDRERDDMSPPCSQGSGDLSHPGAPSSPSQLQLTPVLVESQIQRIADTAAALIKSMPLAELEPKQPNAKKKICKELEVSKLITSLGYSYSSRHNIYTK